MPTRMGGYLNGLVFLMFLMSVGYNNNLLLIFTLFLFGLNLIWVIQTHFHLHALRFNSIVIEDGHAGESQTVQVHWKKSPDGPYRWELVLEQDYESISVKILRHDKESSLGSITLPKRGVWNFKHLRVKTEMPFGLYQVWIFYKIDVDAWVYPALMKKTPELRRIPSDSEGDQSSLIRGPHDVWNLAPYQGDESRKINWKHYARSGELVVKEGEELTKNMVQFVFKDNSPDRELLLSLLASQMVQCARTDILFSLETNRRKTRPGSNAHHLSDCLRELTRC